MRFSLTGQLMLVSRGARTRKLSCRRLLTGYCFTGRLMLSAEKPDTGSFEVEGRMKGSDTFSISSGGEWVGVTFTFEEKVGSKLLAIIKASR